MSNDISKETYQQLNELLQESFACNEDADDCAYNLDFWFLTNMGDIYHHSYAHAFPKLADDISDLMIKLELRPYRKKAEPYRNIIDVFKANLDIAERYQRKIKTAIEVADMNNDYEVKIALENFLIDFLPYVKQAEMWYNKAIAYQGDEQQYDVHFEDFTPYIPVED